MSSDRLGATGFSFQKNAQGSNKPFIFYEREDGGIGCLPAKRETSYEKSYFFKGRTVLYRIDVYIASFEGKTYEHEELSAVQIAPDPICEQEREAHAAWLVIEVERARQRARQEDHERELMFQTFLHSDQLETWLRAQPRRDDNKFLQGSPQTQRDFLGWCFSQHGRPGGEDGWNSLREDRASALLEKLRMIAGRIRAENKASHSKNVT